MRPRSSGYGSPSSSARARSNASNEPSRSPSAARAGRDSAQPQRSPMGSPMRRECSVVASRWAPACSSSPRPMSVSMCPPRPGRSARSSPSRGTVPAAPQVAGGRLQVAERELEPAEHAERWRIARTRPSSPASHARPLRRRGAPPRRGRDPSRSMPWRVPTMPAVRKSWVCSANSSRRRHAPAPAANDPPANRASLSIQRTSPRVTSSPRAAAFASRSSRMARAGRARPAHQEPGQRNAWAFVVLEREAEAFLDVDTAVDQARGDSAAYVSACPTRAIATASRAGSPRRSAASSAARPSASAVANIAHEQVASCGRTGFVRTRRRHLGLGQRLVAEARSVGASVGGSRRA